MVLAIGVPAAVVLGLLPVPRGWRLAALWLVWFVCLAAQTAYLAHPGRAGFFGVDGMDAVQGRVILYWVSQPLIAALLYGVMVGVETMHDRRRTRLATAARPVSST